MKRLFSILVLSALTTTFAAAAHADDSNKPSAKQAILVIGDLIWQGDKVLLGCTLSGIPVALNATAESAPILPLFGDLPALNIDPDGMSRRMGARPHETLSESASFAFVLGGAVTLLEGLVKAAVDVAILMPLDYSAHGRLTGQYHPFKDMRYTWAGTRTIASIMFSDQSICVKALKKIGHDTGQLVDMAKVEQERSAKATEMVWTEIARQGVTGVRTLR